MLAYSRVSKVILFTLRRDYSAKEKQLHPHTHTHTSILHFSPIIRKQSSQCSESAQNKYVQCKKLIIIFAFWKLVDLLFYHNSILPP